MCMCVGEMHNGLPVSMTFPCNFPGVVRIALPVRINFTLKENYMQYSVVK